MGLRAWWRALCARENIMFGTANVREVLVAKADPRAQVWAMITDGTKLCEVIQRKIDAVVAEDCLSGVLWQIPYLRVLERWTLVRAAPSVEGIPDAPPELAA